jgi:pimeloyl-ACP methyl ester carboxylesterase
MERASTAAIPGYPPVDTADIHSALTAIDGQLEKNHPGRIKSRVLMGYSMGAFHTLFLAANPPADGIRFDRYVAIDVPVRLLNAITTLDQFYNAPLEWPEETRAATLKNTFQKVAALQGGEVPFSPDAVLPFNGVESRFLIGTVFRLTLRDLIFASQLRTNMHVLQTPLDKWKREPAYREIMQYSFSDYLTRFVIPYYQTRGVNLATFDAMQRATDLRTYAASFKANPGIRVIENQNDILVSPDDIAWLRDTFGSNRLTLFPNGGHLGNLSETIVQKVMLDDVSDLLAR